MNTYSMRLTEAAEADIEQHSLYLVSRLPDAGARWNKGLITAFGSLQSFPNRCAVDQQDKTYPDITVRRLLYGKYRILFHVIEPESEGERGMVRVLRILHGASAPAAPENE